MNIVILTVDLTKKKQESHCKPKKQTVETIHAHLQ